jgi:hypothetical protein
MLRNLQDSINTMQALHTVYSVQRDNVVNPTRKRKLRVICRRLESSILKAKEAYALMLRDADNAD